MTKLVGIIGIARAGKDTAAARLTDNHLFTQYAFADPLKEMLEAVFGDRFRDGDRETPIWWLGKSPRQLMQTLGTEWGRELVHPDLWVLFAQQTLTLYRSRNYEGMVVSDVRFDNEASWVVSEGGLLIEILRPGAEKVADHRSESGISPSHPRKIVVNDGSIPELYAKLDATLAEFFCGEAAHGH